MSGGVVGEQNERVVLVTGASSGIGSAVATMLAEQGSRIVLTGRRESALDALRDELPNDRAHLVRPLDLENLDRIKPWLESIVSELGAGLAGVVHCAGSSATVPLRTLAPAQFMAIMQTNAGTTAALLSAFLSKKVTVDGAGFIAMSSIAAHVTSAGLSGYSASKHAVESLVRTAALEGRSRRLRVNAIAPGYVATPMLDDARARSPGFDTLLERQFLGTLEPLEVAHACAFLLSPACRSVTGSVLLMDGGFTLSG